MAGPSMITTKPINVAIVGGGFAGLALQIGLQKYPHINSHVYEFTETFSELGAGAVLSPNSQRAMELIDPRIFEGFQRRAAMARLIGKDREVFDGSSVPRTHLQRPSSRAPSSTASRCPNPPWATWTPPSRSS